MLFNSAAFLFCFLPLTAAGFWVLGRGICGAKERIWLIAASLVFYGWWNPRYLALIVGSIAFNYVMGEGIRRLRSVKRDRARLLLVLGVGLNLGTLAYFKYWDLFRASSNTLVGTHFDLLHIALPLGISFFTFEQISFLVDTYRLGSAAHKPLDYSFFVLFFPRVIAGPILRPSELFPQIEGRDARATASDAIVGLTVFVLGLAKKVLIADSVAPAAAAVFNSAAAGAPLHLLEAWGGALAYTVQLYFDFSGYSDMAIGLGLLFGIRLPLNFASPYKAASIIDFWRRWHMSLSRFLRDYLYIPLGGSHEGPARRYVNLMATMVLGGLWHGASWTFAAWGGLHGLYLLINHAWHNVRRSFGFDTAGRWWPMAAARTTSMVAVVVAWVFFRAPTWAAARTMLEGMIGLHGVSVPRRIAPLVSAMSGIRVRGDGLGSFGDVPMAAMVAGGLALALFAPSTAELTAEWQPLKSGDTRGFLGRPSFAGGVVIGAILLFALLTVFRSPPSEFLYYRF
jgi:D-alanyl-lipoteichoic acid acyltransferase DltB (MBOAT superfamily)